MKIASFVRTMLEFLMLKFENHSIDPRNVEVKYYQTLEQVPQHPGKTWKCKKFSIILRVFVWSSTQIAFKMLIKRTYVLQKTFMNSYQPQFWSTKKFEKCRKNTKNNILG